jgi:ABC-type transport system involved in cytochrome c biogenesis permease subunit
MEWISFPVFALSAGILWFSGMALLYSKTGKLLRAAGIMLFSAGIVLIASFIVLLWINLGRPPLRTLGETRLWYLFFLPSTGLFFYLRWGYKWFISYSLVMAYVFLFISLTHPETYDSTLMPALRSAWFVPHVVVYILGYALLGVSTVVAVYGLYMHYSGKFEMQVILLADNLVYLGFAFITLGLLFGALWAKRAWGQYWTWDPKETWAFLTWLGYLIYIHMRFYHQKKIRTGLWILGLVFLILIIAWFGINYLPSAQNSVHVYGS